MPEAQRAEAVQRLLSWPVPDAEQRFTRHDTALYALSVGAGQDATDPRQRDLVDPWSNTLRALPSLPLVLGYPGFWLGGDEVQRACGFSAARVLHVEQSVRLHAPLPVAAQVVGKTRVLGLVDKGADKGSLLYSQRDIHLREDMRLLASCTQVHYLRGFGGFEGLAPTGFVAPAARRFPTTPPDWALTRHTRPEQALLYRLNGDANPLHLDPTTAKAAGFERPILHGMCTAGVVVHAVLEALTGFAATGIRGFSLRMSAPVLPGESITVQCWNDGSFRAISHPRGIAVIEAGHADIETAAALHPTT